MTRDEFRQILAGGIFLLDASTGTALQEAGLPRGACPEAWAAGDGAGQLREIQESYFAAGADAALSCTFGANRLKLGEYGIRPDEVRALNRRLAELSRAAAPKGGLIAGDIGPTGHLVAPFGPLPFEEAVEIFAEQIRGLADGGADLLMIETMMDVQEARAALIAARENGDLPVLASLTFGADGHTLTGSTPEAAAVILGSLGAAAVGCNCSTGPEAMGPLLERMRVVTATPLLAKPNAGLPSIREGRTVFSLGPEEFARATAALADAGAAILGGCCGTGAAHLRALRDATAGRAPLPPAASPRLRLASARKVVTAGPGEPVRLIGERINPTGKKALQAALKEKRYSEVKRLALEQTAAGAELLDLNVGMPGIDEPAVMAELVDLLSVTTDAPLCLDSASPEALSGALRRYPGRALVNSVSGERKKLEKLLPLAAWYGAACIALPLDDDSLPATAAGRAEVAERIGLESARLGLPRHDLAIDGLAMTISQDDAAARETLATVEWAARGFGSNTVLGLSNVSYGLPERRWLNAAFLAMAVSRGLSLVIANPMDETLTALLTAADALDGRDPHCRAYIRRFAATAAPPPALTSAEEADPGRKIYRAVVAGERAEAEAAVREALASGLEASLLVERHLVPAIREVGEKYERKEYFLPQLVLSAEAMERGFAVVEPILARAGGARVGKIVLATVKGDIHDIGKNIVALMLRNHGFAVIDLGKDVAADEILARARAEGATLVGLSALMTTTMTEMAEVIARSRAEGMGLKFLVGGAVLTASYAAEVGADGYAPDAVGAVREAERLLRGSPA